jgi:hypothetical protein
MQDPEAICQRFPSLPPRTVPATNRAKRHRRLRQSPAPRKLRSFQKGGRSEGKRAAQRRASRAAPLDFLDQKGAKTTQRNELRRSRKVSAHDDLIRKSYDSLKLVPRFCTLRTFKTHQTLRLYAPAPTFSNNAIKIGAPFWTQRWGQVLDPKGGVKRWTHFGGQVLPLDGGLGGVVREAFATA